MQHIIELSLAQGSPIDARTREAIVKQFMTNAEVGQAACSSMKVNDAAMRCVLDTKAIEELHRCVYTIEAYPPDH